MQKSMTGIFRDLSNNRRAAAEARNTWGVYRINKSGKRSAEPVTTCIDEAAATAKAAYMSEINGGTQYVAEAL
jgi:hypothetical protein